MGRLSRHIAGLSRSSIGRANVVEVTHWLLLWQLLSRESIRILVVWSTPPALLEVLHQALVG
jgi:hypothetical protein